MINFILLICKNPLACFTAVATLAVAFVNGWTDAPNAIASCVATRSLSLRKAVLLAAFADFAGALIVGTLSGNVTQTMISMADFGSDGNSALVSLSAAMTAVVVWATSAWFFGIPTSESHALVAGLTGASIAVNGGFGGVELVEWLKVVYGLIVSLLLGLAFGFFISKMTVKLFFKKEKQKSDKIFFKCQIASSIFMAFMHGAQDAQKFAGIMILTAQSAAVSINLNNAPILVLVICSVAIAIGTATGGGRIIKAVGMDMIKLRAHQGFSADLAGAICLLISTLFGLPVSTTHTKTCAMIGVGAAKSIKSVNWNVACEMIVAWVLTFPGCGLLGWAICCAFLKIF